MKIGCADSRRCPGGELSQCQTVAVLRRGQRGATLVEVIIAVVILAILGAGIVSSINYGMFMMLLARENARATQVMLEKLESIRLYDWYEVTSNGFVPSQFTDVYDPQGASNQQGAVYYGQLFVSNVPWAGSYSTNLRQFTVTLQWTTAGRIQHTRSLSTYVARDGVQNYVY
jgi:prepilin-type N-terminal cleavage/methylation domain-containing protein